VLSMGGTEGQNIDAHLPSYCLSSAQVGNFHH
jgi:hypothetical protein